MDNPTPAPPLDEVKSLSGVEDVPPFTHITFCLVAWNEERRLGPLLERVRPYFERLVVGVQKSTDATLDIARRYADLVIEDSHHGFGDATFGPRLLPKVQSRWTLKLDADEWPSDDLLPYLSNATWYAEHNGYDGVWIPFGSSVEGQEYNEQHAHLRLFETNLGWPGMLHSRPPARKMMLWPTGHIRHDRSLDELVADYLRYLSHSGGNKSWTEHNQQMLRSACSGTADAFGWDNVKDRPWWPDVLHQAFGDVDPEKQETHS